MSNPTPPSGPARGAVIAPHTFMVHGDLMVSFALPGRMADEPWNRFVTAVRGSPVRYYLNAQVGTVEISSAQRTLISGVLTSKGITTAFITDDSVSRGVATAASWMGARMKAFPWKDLRKGLEYLHTPPTVAASVEAELSRMRTAGRVG